VRPRPAHGDQLRRAGRCPAARSRHRGGRVKRTRTALLAGLTGLLLSACSGGSGLTPPGDSSGNTVERIAPADRGAPLTVSGTTLDGAALSTASYRGKVVVLNYWGSWCPPCVKETPDLKVAWE